MTDTTLVTWKDRNGNVYGPVSAAFTTNILAGHPEGYLTLSGETGLPDYTGVAKTVVATALDGFGQPVSGVAVHVAVTGVNARTLDGVTGGDGKASFQYAGANMGSDVVVATATIVSTVVTSNPVHVSWYTPVQAPCTGRNLPLDVIVVLDVSGSMLLEGKLDARRPPRRSSSTGSACRRSTRWASSASARATTSCRT